MSFAIKAKSNITNVTFLQAACDRLRQAEVLVVGPVALTSGSHAGLFEVRLPGFHYPIKINCNTGEMTHDWEDGRQAQGQLAGDRLAMYNRLRVEYGAAAIESAAEAQGAKITYSSVDQNTGVMTLKLEKQSEINVYG